MSDRPLVVVGAQRDRTVAVPVLLTITSAGQAMLVLTEPLAAEELERVHAWVAAVNGESRVTLGEVRAAAPSTPAEAAPTHDNPQAPPYEGTVSPGALVREDDMSWWFDPCPSCGERTRARVESRSEGGRTLPRVLRCTSHVAGLGRCRAWMNYGLAESTWKARRRAARREGPAPSVEAEHEPETTEEGDDGSTDSAV